MKLKLLRYLVLATLVLLLDQLSKWAALGNLQMGVPEPILPFLNWLLLLNPGAAFSFLAQGSGWQRWFFTVLGLGAAIYIVYLLYKSQSEKMLYFVPGFRIRIRILIRIQSKYFYFFKKKPQFFG